MMLVSKNFLAEQPEDVLPDFAKFLFLAAVFVATFISTALPLQLVSKLRNVIDREKQLFYQRCVSIMNCFAGGVFMGTALLDLFPQVTSRMKQAFPSNKFPFAEFLVAFGLLLILSIEQIAVDCNDKSSDCRSPIERLQSRNSQLERETLTTNVQVELNKPPSPPFPEPNPPVKSQSKFNSVILLLALSVHSLFEGLTIGLLKSPSVVLQIFIAILVHKIPVAFSLGLSLVQSELKTSAVIHFDLWFSLMTPIGAGIGILLNTLSDMDLNLVNGILIGLSTGTFIYIVFVEVLPKELKQEGPRLLNLIFLLIGFSVVCVAVLVETTIS